MGDRGQRLSGYFPYLLTIFGLIISGIAAFYAYRQSSIAQDTAQRQLRAYLGVDMTDFMWSREGSGKIWVNFKVVDYGETPCRNLEVKTDIRILPLNLSAQFCPEYKSDRSPEPNAVVFPDHPYHCSVESDEPIQLQDFNRAISFQSENRIFIFVSLTYDDVFDIQRHTLYCAYLVPLSTNTTLSTKGDWFWSVAKTHNGFD